MASASDYLETQLGAHVLRTASMTKPTALWMGLFKVKPGEDGTGGTEVTAASYARVQCGPGDAVWSAPLLGSGEHVNLVDFTFPTPVEDWGKNPTPIVAAGIFDAATGGNLLISETLLVPQEVVAGGLPPKFAAGDFKITFA